MKERNNRAVAYRRLSARDQSKYSLGYQERSIKDYCHRNGLELLNIYTDNGESSYTFDRPDYRALEAFIKKHKGQARYLIIMDHDRFSRNLTEALAKIDELEDKFSIKVIATNEDIDLDTADPDVFIQRAFKYLIANQELLRIRKRTKDGIRSAQGLGRYVNIAPYGYINKKDESGKGILEIDEEKAAIVRFIFKEFVQGTPVYLIHLAAKKMGFERKGHSVIYNIVANPLYSGQVKVNADKKNPEKLVPGIHQPIISELTYQLALERLGIKKKTKVQPREDFPLRGILKCHCGHNMTAGYSKGKSKYYLYYRCHVHTSKNYGGDFLHNAFYNILESLSFSERQIKTMSDKLNNNIESQIVERAAAIDERNKQLVQVRNKLERLEERLINDEIDGPTYKKWQGRLNQERVVLEDSIDQMSTEGIHRRFDKVKRYLPLLSDLGGVYNAANFNGKQLLLKTVFKVGISINEGRLTTPYIHPALAHNILAIKEKGLLEIEEPLSSSGKIPSCT